MAVVEVRNENRDLAVRLRHDGDARRPRHRGGDGRTIVAGESPRAVARNGRDDLRFGVDAPDTIVMHVGDIDRHDGAVSDLERDVARHVEVSARRGPAVADILSLAGRAVAGDRVDQTGLRIDHPDPVVERVGDIDIAVGRRGDGARRVQRRLGRGLLVAVVAVLAGAGDRRDDFRGPVDAADAIVVRVGDHEVAVGRNRHAVGCVELRDDGGAVVAGKA